MANTEFLLGLNRDDVDKLSTSDLRATFTESGLYGIHESVATIPVSSPEVVGKSGTLTILDKAIAALIAAYGDRGGHVVASYGNSVEIKIFAADDTLKSSLKYAIERAHESAGAFND